MSTQGIVSIVQDGKTLVKAIAGDNGFNAKKLAGRIRQARLASAVDVLKAAQELRFGCKDCLVVMDSESEYGHENALEDGLPPLYRLSFADPEFNPRWQQGSADYVELVDVSELVDETLSA